MLISLMMNESERSLVPVWAKELKPAGKYYFSGPVFILDHILMIIMKKI